MSQFYSQAGDGYTSQVVPVAYPQPQQKGNGVFVAVVSGLVVIVVLLVAALLWMMVGFNEGEKSSSLQTVTETVAQQPNTVPAADQPKLAEQSQPSGRLAGGSLQSAWPGTSVTSNQFTARVHAAYVNYRSSTGKVSGTVRVYSPVTGKTYDMWCGPSNGLIRCSGGNNAVVYIGD